MPSDYGYINARIRAMKSFLLKESDYQEAFRQKTLDEFSAFLSSLPAYANDLQKIPLEQPLNLRCEEALKLNLCRILRKIINFIEGEPKKLILACLGAWDLYNLKTIVRGILGFHNSDQILEAIVPAGRWDFAFLSALAFAKDLKELTNILLASTDGSLERDFASAIRDFSCGQSLELLENSLQELYFKNALESSSDKDYNSRIILDYLCLEIDISNIILVLKHPLSTQLRFIKGGSLSEAFLKDLTRLKSPEEILKGFAGSDYGWLAQEGLDLYQRTQRLSSLERLLKNKLFSFCLKLYTSSDPLCVGIPLAFINFKENEINNLRLVSKAIFYHLPTDLIRSEIIYAQ